VHKDWIHKEMDKDQAFRDEDLSYKLIVANSNMALCCWGREGDVYSFIWTSALDVKDMD